MNETADGHRDQATATLAIYFLAWAIPLMLATLISHAVLGTERAAQDDVKFVPFPTLMLAACTATCAAGAAVTSGWWMARRASRSIRTRRRNS